MKRAPTEDVSGCCSLFPCKPVYMLLIEHINYWIDVCGLELTHSVFDKVFDKVL